MEGATGKLAKQARTKPIIVEIKEIKIANVLGLDETNAKLELLKQGFLYGNIEVLEKYDEDHEPGTVLEQEPKYGTQVSSDSAVKIYINSYTGSSDSSTD